LPDGRADPTQIDEIACQMQVTERLVRHPKTCRAPITRRILRVYMRGTEGIAQFRAFIFSGIYSTLSA
jgi:hypothetical protein